MLLRLFIALSLLTGCAPGAVAPAPTAVPQSRYTHASGVFSLALPPGWTSGDLSEGAALLATFAPAGADHPALTVYATRLATVPDEDAFRAAMEAYLGAPHNAALETHDRAAMGDGSWRITGVRRFQDRALPVNLFLQRDGPFFSALEVIVPADDPAALATLTDLVNSYRVDAAVDWPVGDAATVPMSGAAWITAEGNLSFSALLPWTDDLGRFHITGRLANRVPYAVEEIVITATLYDSAGGVIGEQTGVLPTSILPDGEYLPFDVRFDSGWPLAATRYALRVEARQAADSLATFYGPQAFDWEDRAEYDDQGALHVRGTVRNTGGQTAYNMQVIITLFDAQEHAIGYTTASLGQGFPLEEGATAQFDAPIPRLGGSPASYLVTVQAQTQPGPS